MFHPIDVRNNIYDVIKGIEGGAARDAVSSKDMETLRRMIEDIREHEKALISSGTFYKYEPKEEPNFTEDWRKLIGETAKFLREGRMIRFHDGYNWNEYSLTKEDIYNGYIFFNRDFPMLDLFRPYAAPYNYILVSDRSIELANKNQPQPVPRPC